MSTINGSNRSTLILSGSIRLNGMESRSTKRGEVGIESGMGWVRDGLGRTGWEGGREGGEANTGARDGERNKEGGMSSASKEEGKSLDEELEMLDWGSECDKDWAASPPGDGFGTDCDSSDIPSPSSTTMT